MIYIQIVTNFETFTVKFLKNDCTLCDNFLNSVITRFEITKFVITKFLFAQFIFLETEIMKFEIKKFIIKKFVSINF